MFMYYHLFSYSSEQIVMTNYAGAADSSYEKNNIQ